MRNLWLCSALIAFLAAPAFAFKCPAKGGAQWREYRSELRAATQARPDDFRSQSRAERMFARFSQKNDAHERTAQMQAACSQREVSSQTKPQ